ncbi:uncharacterized protein LOC116618150 [Nematostella vectensis]|uniref:uncharacterized protein LOC116618150 n=1 Tax=Nematostella vectensis TaxID=45351 RepID=UPI002076DD7E|nr:uncharacterized protein LOC116618150 [Nematostella vectensis]
MKFLVFFAVCTAFVSVHCTEIQPKIRLVKVERPKRAINPLDFFGHQVNKPTPKPTTVPTQEPRKGEMPEKFREVLAKMKTPNELLKHFGVTDSMQQRIQAMNRGSLAQSGIQSMNMVKESYCGLHPQKFEIKQDRLHIGMYFPYVFQVPRCSGAVLFYGHVECVPRRKATINYHVHWIPTTSESSYAMLPVPIEVDLECEEACRIKSHHCDPIRQYYDERTCSCKCKANYTYFKLGYKCGKEPDYEFTRYSEEKCDCVCALDNKHCDILKQIWDKEKCKCICPPSIKCPGGQSMDETCECRSKVNPFNFFGGKK